jgi:hypothetical protein
LWDYEQCWNFLDRGVDGAFTARSVAAMAEMGTTPMVRVVLTVMLLVMVMMRLVRVWV